MASRSFVLVVFLFGISANGKDPSKGQTYTFQDIMKNPENCPLNAGPPFSWLVRVWDIGNQTTVSHGALFTFLSVLTTVRSVCGDLGCFFTAEEHAQNFEVIGQTIYNLSQPDKPCSQTRKVTKFYPHPKHFGANMTFFDFGIFILEKPFNYSSPSYPLMAYSSSAMDLMKDIRAVNRETTKTLCGVTIFTEQAKRMPILLKENGVGSIPFKTQCVDLICEQNPVEENFLKMCKNRFSRRANATMLCMKPEKSARIGVDYHNIRFWHAGAHINCFRSIGIVIQGKFRAGYPTTQQDFYIVLTFLRVFRWLQRTRANLSPMMPKGFTIPPLRPRSHPTVNVFRPVPVPGTHGFGSISVSPSIIAIFFTYITVRFAAKFE